MPFWNSNLKPSKKISLQEHTKRRKTLIDSLKHSKFQTGFRRASRFALLFGKKGVQASITAEAALVLPLFLFAMVNLLSLFLMFHRYSAQLAELHQMGRELSMLAYAEGEGAQEQDVELMRVSRVEPIVGVMGYPGSLIVNGCVMHKWIGYDVSGAGENGPEREEMVYVTANGSAYHGSRSCVYLNPSVQTVSREQVQSLRNGSGERYKPCETCGGGGDLVYITEYGTRYHGTIGCGGLKRTVDCVSLETALEMGKHACPRCGG